jgi:hydrogenase maturation protease
MDEIDSLNKRVLVIGIGNELRTDDAAGILAARLVKKLELGDADVIESCGDGAELIELWTGRQNVIIIDAVKSGSPPGTIHRFKVNSSRLPSEFFKFSTHLFSVPQAIYLSASLGKLPENLIIFGIEAKSFEMGSGLTPKIENAINNIIELVHKEIIKLKGNTKHYTQKLYSKTIKENITDG